MNKKDIKQEIKKAYQVPDVRSKIDFMNIQIEPKQHKQTKRSFGFSRIRIQFTAVMIMALLLGFSFFLFNPKSNPVYERVTLTASEQDTFGVVSTSLLSDTTIFDETAVLQSVLFVQETSLFSNHIDNFNRHVNMVELFVGNKNKFTIKAQPDELAILGYEHYMTLHFIDIQNNEVVYDYYYSGDHNSHTTGLMVIDSKYHYVEINKEVDNGDEQTTYLVYQDPVKKDKNYIKMETEKDIDGEQVFKYMTFLNGNEISVSEIKLQREANKTDVEVDIEFEDKQSDIKFKLRINRYNLNGVDTLRGKYEIDTKDDEEEGFVEIKVFLDPISNRYEYEYLFKNNKHQRGNRHHNMGRPFQDDDDDEDQDLEWNNNETTLFDIWEEDFKDYYDNFDDFKQNFEGWKNRYQSIYQDFDDFMDDYEDWLDDYQDEFNTFDEWFNYFRNRHRGMR